MAANPPVSGASTTTGAPTTTTIPPTSGNASSGIGSTLASGAPSTATTGSYVPPVSHPQPGSDCRKPGS